MRWQKGWAGIIVAVTVLVGGCGYAFQGSVPRSVVGRVYLTITDANTFQGGLGRNLLVAVRQRITSAGGQVVEDRATADVVVEGAITGYAQQALSFDVRDTARRFRLTISLSLAVERQGGPRGGGIQEEVVGEAYYTTPAGVTEAKASEAEAARRAIESLAGQVMARMAEVR
ncbi:MAG: LPS assembly lipoprotein LptE [Candidatus Methylomirabilales bacterium]